MTYKSENTQENKPCPVKSLLDAINAEVALAETALTAAKATLSHLDTLLQNENND